MIKTIVKLAGILSAFSISFLQCIQMVLAYFNGIMTGHYQITVYYDLYGEQHEEIVMMLIFMGIIICSTIMLISDIIRKESVHKTNNKHFLTIGIKKLYKKIKVYLNHEYT